ncbi:hypothetical protein FHL15_007274 [Xylaria flabelliformis]|uniref:non-specific serine/threonine protein kinase n=1 Tax=Xylaria flabelliformis TaxID=2512241 RepID=A0A553HUU6_9PEZI|nr:hypothetical protein FHL15_007274 [Xylaria flabelliformis]
MSKSSTVRKYGKQSKKPRAAAGRLFVELPQTPIRTAKTALIDDPVADDDEILAKLAHSFSTVKIQDENIEPTKSPLPPRRSTRQSVLLNPPEDKTIKSLTPSKSVPVLPEPKPRIEVQEDEEAEFAPSLQEESKELQVLSWAEVCPPGDSIIKIAEASYAEVYRVTNDRGTSIIKVIRMSSPIKPQTKTQQKSGLVDEEPHSESDLRGELQISEWLADIPGFVVYKERYIVQGKACRELLETHQAFHKKLKRQDPDRLQFYPSPSRYLDDTKFLVVELGDAGTALEDFELATADQLWDIFFHVAIALARAEVGIEFEHRDLHEGNLCIRKVSEPIPKDERDRTGYFGFSGLEITILDYGLSRAQGDHSSEPVAYDLERDLSIFTSEHAAQCRVYRQMRSFLLRGDRVCLPPEDHRKPYSEGIDGPITWTIHEPYTNVLWLAYLYEWMVENFRGLKKELNSFKRATKELWSYLNPEADENTPGFASASDILCYGVEIGWIDEDHLMGGRDEAEKSILSILTTDDIEGSVADRLVRRSPRKQRPSPV